MKINTFTLCDPTIQITVIMAESADQLDLEHVQVQRVVITT